MTPVEGGLFIGGEWIQRSDRIEVFNPFDEAAAGSVVRGSAEDVHAAVHAAGESLKASWPAHERYRVLMRAADLLDAAAGGTAAILAAEGSKTIREAQREPPRSADILRLSADASRRVTGRTLPFDTRPGSEQRKGWYDRHPVGIVAAILPFNDPLAVAAHKVGPALAACNAVVLKPDSRTPLSVVRLTQIFEEAGLPPGRLNLITGDGEVVGEALVRHPKVRLVSFTGGLATGRKIAAAAGIKKLVMELGSNSAVIIMDDADLDRAVPALVSGAFAQAGQNCLGVQRVFVHRSVEAELTRRLVAATEDLRSGHSLDTTVDVCAMIRVEQAERVEEWLREAIAGGARVLTGGKRSGAVVEPTILTGVPRGCRLDCEEVYGPVMSIEGVDGLEEAVERTNSVDYGLHAAIFTRRIDDAFTAAGALQVGAVIVNDSTDYRLDAMPFGGVKSSGLGREGIDAAVDSMTEERVVCFNL